MSIVLVTGANGFVGSRVVLALLNAGHTVIGVTKNPVFKVDTHPNLSWRIANFADISTLSSLCDGVDIIIHLAARKNDERDSYTVNVLATKVLLEEAKQSKVQMFIFCSTQSAKLPKRGVYAQTKLEAEQCVMDASSTLQTVIYRPSILYDHSSKGIIGTIAKMVQGAFVPIFGDGSVTFRPMHLDDFADLVVQTIKAPPHSTPYDVGGLTEISFTSLVKSIAKVFEAKPRLIYIPAFFCYVIAGIIRFIPKFPITKSNILGAIQLVPMDIEPISSSVQFHNRAFDPTLFLHKNDYFLEQEARMLLHYLDKRISFELHPELLLHYANACKQHRIDTVYIPSMPRVFLYCLDAATAVFVKHCLLRKKLLIATAVFETHPVSAHLIEVNNKSLLSLTIPLMYHLFLMVLCVLLGIPLLLLTTHYHGRTV